MSLKVFIPLKFFGTFPKGKVKLLQIVDKIYLWSHQVWDFCLLLNTFSISVLVFHLFIFSISPWFSLERLYFSSSWSISSRLYILLPYICLYCLLWSFKSLSFISVLIFMISLLLLTLGLVCSYFSSCFSCNIRLFI